MQAPDSQVIIYNTPYGKASVSLYAHDGSVWMSQKQLAELFDTSVPNINTHIANILKERELSEKSVVKYYLTTASDGKQYKVAIYAQEMILAIGFRGRGKPAGRVSDHHHSPALLADGASLIRLRTKKDVAASLYNSGRF